MIEGKYTRVRVIDSTDAEYVRKLRNSPQILQFYQDRYFVSDVQQRIFLESLADNKHRIFYVGEDKETGQRFGVFCYQHIDYRSQRAEGGQFLDPELHSYAIHAFEASFLLLDYGFQYLNLQKVTGEVLASNRPAIRYSEATGMKQEGLLKRHVFFDGGFRDVIVFGMFRDDFYNKPTKVMEMFFRERAERAPKAEP